MSEKKQECFKGFFFLSRAYYAKRSFAKPGMEPADEIMIGMYHPEGGTDREFAVRWYKFIDPPVHMRLEVFDDGWKIFHAMHELHQLITRASAARMGPDQFSQELVQLGYKDLTPYVNPNPPLMVACISCGGTGKMQAIAGRS